MLWPVGAPTWLVIGGHASLSLVLFCIVVLLLPEETILRIKILRRVKNYLMKGIRRLVKITKQSPLVRLGVFCGRKCSCGLLSSRCSAPQGLKAKSIGCSEVVLDWSPASSRNPFHEEQYVLAWRLTSGTDTDWIDVEVEENDSADTSGKKWRFFMKELPEEENIFVRVAARNRRGQGPWSQEVSAETFGKPCSEGGFTGPLGVAGRSYGTGKYSWTQTTTEVGLKVPIPKQWRGKQISFKALPHRIQILYTAGSGSEDEELLVGNFPKKVKSDDVFWEIEDGGPHGRHIAVQMQKAEKMDKWHCLLEGHPCIDVRLVRFYTKEMMGGLDIYED